MTSRYLTASGPATASGNPCPCGCGQRPCKCATGTPATCCGACECDTGCLSRPRFYCGMVLTDDQLNDLAQWVRHRSALHRHVEGWGVVRGLGVRCDPGRPGTVIVGPGYARSCCGDDIVVCEDLCLDVCACCESPGPCCDDPKPPARHTGTAEHGRRAVDVYLRYTETPTDPTRAVASCGCGGHDGIQYERLAEGGALSCVQVADTTTDPATLAAQDWERGYASCATVVTDYLREVSATARAGDRLTWLLSWIDRSGDDALCCVRRRLCRDGLGEAGIVGALLEIVYALRNRYLETTYGECHPMPGVLLARVWLCADENGGCAVECIDSYPPFRRVITAPGWPQKPGFLNLAELIWQRRAIACERVRKLGLPITWSQHTQPRDAAGLAQELDGDCPFVRCDAAVEACLYRDPCGHWAGDEPDGRVVRLLPTAGQPAPGRGGDEPSPAAPEEKPAGTPPADDHSPPAGPRRRRTGQ